MKKSLIQPIQKLEALKTDPGNALATLAVVLALEERLVNKINELVARTNKNSEDIKFLADSLGKDILK